MTTTAQRAGLATATATARPAARLPLRRACACGTHTPLGSECESCRKKKVQAKFAVGAANDAFEREADAVAEQVLRRTPVSATTPSPVAVRRHADRATDGADAPASVDAVLARNGAPLETGLRADMEARFGHDFSQVRTHTDAAAGRSAQEIGASAYTAGHHVVFGHGRYAPSTPGGRQLIAHELTHVLQQTPGVVRRTPGKAPAKAPAPKPLTAADAPKLDFQVAKNKPPCACLVFIHHDEQNARVIAKNLYEFCKYNFAIVNTGRASGSRPVKLPAHKDVVDPNALFPRSVAEACWKDDKPCRDTMAANAGKTDEKSVRDYVEAQFFIALRDCSNGFTLPIIGLHNNSLDDTASYHADRAKTTGAPDLTKIEGKTFDKSLAAGATSPSGALPYADFKTWAKTLSGVKEDATTTKLKGGPFQKGKTNIFIWCQAGDNTKCHIGNPKQPDNVVWVTNETDFNTLRGKPINVALQTQIEPGGDSETDLSSLFVTLADVVGQHYGKLDAASQTQIGIKLSVVQTLQANWAHLIASFAWDAASIVQTQLQQEMQQLAALVADRAKNTSEHSNLDRQRRFVNIETPPKELLGEAGLVDSLNAVRTTLAAVGLDCCDTKPAAGETESAAEKLEKAVRGAALKPKPKPKPKAGSKAKGKS
jgi:hypothetical protein